MDVMAPVAGVIEAFLVEDGSTIGPNQPVLKMTTTTGSTAPTTNATAAPVEVAIVVPEPIVPAKNIIEIVSTPTSMPLVPSIPTKPISVTNASQVAVTPLKMNIVLSNNVSNTNADPTKIGGTRAETKVKMSKMRRTVATRLKDAQNTTAMLTTFNEINMG